MLSFSYIVKNEEKNIINSLNSIKDIADEIVIVDTGSTDNTKDLIRQWGGNVKLLEMEWVDFACCRNYSMDNCTGDYIFIIDADETLRDPEAVKRLMSDDTVDIWSVIQLDKTGQMCYTFRLVKSDCRYKYELFDDVIHENISTEGKNVAYSDLILDHHKELTPEEHKAKVENIMSVFADIPEGIKKDYYEGVYLLWNNQHKEAFKKLNRCINEVNPQLKAFIYLMVGHYYSLISEVYKAETLHLYNKSLEIAPEQNEGYMKLADFYLNNGDKQNALNHLHTLKNRKNRLRTQMQNDMYYTTEQIDSKINLIGVN